MRIKSILSAGIDAITRGRGVERKVDGQKIRFPFKWSRYYDHVYDPATLEFFAAHLRPGDTVLDIGGHIGLFAVVTARMVGPSGKIFSFEPTPFTRAVLGQVVELNKCGDIVEVRGEAVSVESGETVFYDTGDEVSNANSLVRTERSKGEIRVPTISVDAFLAERDLMVNCIKIDVEGAELDVLIGAERTFREQRPVARLGLHPKSISQNGQSLDEIWERLMDYKVNVIFDGELMDRDRFVSQADLFDVNLIPS